MTLPCHQSHLARFKAPGQCLDQAEIVNYDGEYCEPERDIDECPEIVSYRYSCGHLGRVKCSDAFKWASNNDAATACDTVTKITNPICKHDLSLKCSYAQKLIDWIPWSAESPFVTQIVCGFDENNEPTNGLVMEEHKLEMSQLPAGINRKMLSCNMPMSVNRSCGHTSNNICSDAYFNNMGVCKDIEVVYCEREGCGIERKITCSEFCIEIKNGQKKPCQALHSKRCSVCEINEVMTECYKTVVSCNKEVTLTLHCGHECSWQCGSGFDPRGVDYQCRSCIVPFWIDSAEYKATSEDIMSMKECLQFRVGDFLKAIDPKCDVKFIDTNDKIIGQHLNSRKIILTKFLDVMAITDGKFPDLPPVPGSANFADVYDLLFTRGQNNGIFPTNQATIYGFGVELRRLTVENLRRIKTVGKIALKDGGQLDINIFVAFKQTSLVETPPFVDMKKKHGNKGGEKANKTALVFQNKGYDSVSFTNDDYEKGVYWTPKSVMKIAEAVIRFHSKCKICLDMFDETDGGYSCSNQHFTCWECLEACIHACGSPDAVGKTIDSEGNVKCVEPGCDQCITTLKLSKVSGCPELVFKSLEELKVTSIAAIKVATALAEQEARLQAEYNRIKAIQDKQERDIEMLKLDICNSILNLHCPRCRMVNQSCYYILFFLILILI